MLIERQFDSIVQDLAQGGRIDYRRTSRLLRDTHRHEDVRVALMGNMTLDLLTPFLMVEAARIGQMSAFHVAPFGQHMQHLFSEELAGFAPDAMLLILSPSALRPDAFENFLNLSVKDRQHLRDDVIAEVGRWVATALERSKATLMVANFIAPRPALGIADLAEDYGEAEFYLDLNLHLMRAMRAHPRVQLLDVASAAARIGLDQAYDSRLHFLAKMDWTEAMMREVAAGFARNLVGTLGLARKCLVLDLDNSLWGGVVGEDGPHGVRVGLGDMVSEAFRAFQLRVRDLKHRGILLALCSKNNPEDVAELFRLRTDMPLRLEDIAAQAISWEPKHEGLRRIARTLNIGLDALVFMDDNPAEIAAVRAHCPEVECVLLPRDPSDYVAALDGLKSFEKARLTAEDAQKGAHYSAAAQRAANAGAMDQMDYLRDLEMRARIRPATSADLLRIHQLFGKTNQFNLMTQRLSMGEVEAELEAADRRLVVAELSDRFGDLGLVGLYALHDSAEGMEIAHFLMSCRAMGRGLESAIMNNAKRRFLARRDCRTLIGRYRETAKNIPVRTFYADQGFTAEPEEGGARYTLDRQDVRLADCGWISLEDAI